MLKSDDVNQIDVKQDEHYLNSKKRLNLYKNLLYMWKDNEQDPSGRGAKRLFKDLNL